MCSKIDWSNFKAPEGYIEVPLSRLRFSDNYRNFSIFKQLINDGIPLDLILKVDDYGSPLFRLPSGKQFFLFLFTEIERYIINYLLIGKNRGIPSYPANDTIIKYDDIDSDYIYKHIKREIERGEGKYTHKKEKQNDIDGIRFIGLYPYGSIDYGFFPYSWEELNTRLENIEAFPAPSQEQDIPILDDNSLPIELEYLKDEKDHLDSVLAEIPSNTIIDKTICGCGATWLEITNEKRNSIIIEPNVPVIIGKQLKHKHLIGVYGNNIEAKEITARIKEQSGCIKIMTTPDSYPKVVKALKSLNIPYQDDYFLLFDECEKIVSDIDYRKNIILPIDDFFEFKNKAMVSATPIIVNDPRFKEQEFKIIKIKPLYDHKQLLELKHTNNVSLAFKRTIKKLDEDSIACVFYNSPTGIIEFIDLLGIGDQSNIYCSTEAKKTIKGDGYNVFDTIEVEKGKAVLNKYNFFTSRFYSAVDIELDYKPVVIMITQVFKTIKDKTPYSLIDPETEAIQIAGRFRYGIDKIIHITDTNPKLEYHSREEWEQFLTEQHVGLHKMNNLLESVKSHGEKYIIYEAIKNTEYYQEGYVNIKNGEINYFRYNNAYLDERLKMIYRYSSTLHKAYMRSGAFIISSNSEYAIYTEQERNVLLNKNNSKALRINLLNDVLKRIENFSNVYDPQFIAELKKEYSLYIEALQYLKLRRIKQLEFKDSAVKTELTKAKRTSQLLDEEVRNDVYAIFAPNSNHPTEYVNEHLKSIFDKHGISYDRRGTAGDILQYFYGQYRRGTRGAGRWELLDRKY